MRINYKTKELLDETKMQQKEVEYAIRKTKLQLDADILTTEEELDTKRMELEILKTTYPLDTQAFINMKSEIECL